MRTVTLEFLRHGPPHNQLLSPVTQYLGLCGNHGAVTIQLKFEHSEFLVRLRALSYKDSRETRELQLTATAREMGEILAGVPGLIAELAECRDHKADLVHLRLILSANELALLPLEASTAPNGFPGAGQFLALQPDLPLCITREVRRVFGHPVDWPRKPKILFAAASPAGVAPVPLHNHLLVLRKVIEPWVYYLDPVQERRKEVAKYLTVLPQATADDLQRACATGEYTHVHLLAHGLPVDKAGDRRFGLALHDSRDPRQPDLVEGPRLATLLRPLADRGKPQLVQPTVVTIAACDAANVGSVVGAGASVAHALHEAGIPLVVAAQFPLSFAGSVVLTQSLYEDLLWGKDLRWLLYHLRHQLQSRVPESHDWASLVAYASLPPDLDRQLADVRFRQAKGSLDGALKYVDRVIKLSQGGSNDKDLNPALQKLARARQRMEELLDETLQDRVEILGLLAAAEKRVAEILHQAAKRGISITGVTAKLQKAHDYYRQAFLSDHSRSWCLVQMLALTAVLKGGDAVEGDLWHLARLLSLQEFQSDDRQTKAWALGNLIELYLLSALMNIKDRPADARVQALNYFGALVALAGPESFEVHSTRRQMRRYIEFFQSEQPEWQDVVQLAKDLLEAFPAPEQSS